MFFKLLIFLFLLLIFLLHLSKNCILRYEYVHIPKRITERSSESVITEIGLINCYGFRFIVLRNTEINKEKRELAELEPNSKTKEAEHDTKNQCNTKIQEQNDNLQSNDKSKLDLSKSSAKEQKDQCDSSVFPKMRKEKKGNFDAEKNGWLTQLIVNSTHGIVTPTSLRMFELLFRVFGVRWNNLDFLKHIKNSEVILLEQKHLFEKHVSSFSTYFKMIETALENISNLKRESVVETFEAANQIIKPINEKIEETLHFLELHEKMFNALKKLLLSISFHIFCEPEILNEHLEKKERLLGIIYAILQVIPASPEGDAYIFVSALETNKHRIDIELSKINLRTQKLFTRILSEFEKLKHEEPLITFDLFLLFLKSRYDSSEEISRIKEIQKIFNDFSNIENSLLKQKYECIISLLQSKTELIGAFSSLDLHYNAKRAKDVRDFFIDNAGCEMPLLKVITDFKLEVQLNSLLMELKEILQNAIDVCKYADYFPENYVNNVMRDLYLGTTDLKKKAEDYFSCISSIKKMLKAETNMKKLVKLTAVLKNIIAYIMILTTSELKHLNVLILLGHSKELVEQHHNTQCIYKTYLTKIAEFQNMLGTLFKNK